MRTILETVEKAREARPTISVPANGKPAAAEPINPLLALVPQQACRVLLVGERTAARREVLQRRQAVEVVRWEQRPEPPARQETPDGLEELVRGNLGVDGCDFPNGRFDCIVCDEVLGGSGSLLRFH